MGLKTSLHFLGAAGTVTGSRTLVNHNRQKVLVDCGLFQGPRWIRDYNWQPFQHSQEIDGVILTHAHIDHSGFLPRIVKEGYRGPVYCSRGTYELCKTLLPDAARLQEEDARFANVAKHSRHDPALPLFDQDDAEQALSLMKPMAQDAWHEVLPNFHLQLMRSGHILGATFVQLRLQNHDFVHTLTFSGDIGNNRSNIIKGPLPIRETDSLVLEATYGDRRQSRESPLKPLAYIINKVIRRGGTLIIPAFAVGRTQEIIYLIRELEEAGEIPSVPVYVDSPMALDATSIYLAFQDELKPDLNHGRSESPISCRDYRAVNSADESMMLCVSDEPKIIISAAGMLSGGRVLHHLKAKLPDAKNGVLFVGYQATGTKGLLLKNGLPEISIHHTLVNVEAEIFVIDGLSAHGDCEDIMEWLGHFKKFPRKIFLNHGEDNSLQSLRYMIRSHYDCEVIIPKMNEKIEI